MPYQSWGLLPQGSPDHTHLNIVGGAVEIGVDIQGGRCTLTGPTEEPAVQHILNRTMSARELIEVLSLSLSIYLSSSLSLSLSVCVCVCVCVSCVYVQIVHSISTGPEEGWSKLLP